MNNAYFKTPPVVKNLIIINVLIFMATVMLPVGRYIDALGSLYWFENPRFHSYQLVTYMFLHADLSHLFFNMFALWMFGRTLEYELGSRRFLIYYMVCGVGAALIQMATVLLSGEIYIQLLGASGAVMGLLLAFGVLHPNVPIIFLFLPIPIKAKWFVLIYGLIELFQGWTGVGNVAHFAHVGGMLWGLGLLWWWRKRGVIRF